MWAVVRSRKVSGHQCLRNLLKPLPLTFLWEGHVGCEMQNAPCGERGTSHQPHFQSYSPFSTLLGRPGEEAVEGKRL